MSHKASHTWCSGENGQHLPVAPSFLLQNLPKIYSHPPGLFVIVLLYCLPHGCMLIRNTLQEPKATSSGSLPWFLFTLNLLDNSFVSLCICHVLLVVPLCNCRRFSGYSTVSVSFLPPGCLPCPKFLCMCFFCPHYSCVCAQKAETCANFFVFTPIVSGRHFSPSFVQGSAHCRSQRNSFKLLMV